MKKIKIIQLGKTHKQELSYLISDYQRRLSFFYDFQCITIKQAKENKVDPLMVKKMETEKFLKKIDANDFVILLDENGKRFNSINFASFLKDIIQWNNRPIVFLIGGAFGFSESIYKRANHLVALSEMTFSHQLVRLIFMEQLYRACTIINHKPYHHD